MAELGHRAGACSQLGPILSRPGPSRPVPWGHADGQDGRGAGADPPHSSRAPSPGHTGALPAWGAQGWAVFSGLSRSPSALAALTLYQTQPWTGHKSTIPPVAASAEQRRYLQPSPPGLGLLSLLSRAPCLEHPMDPPSLPALLLQMICEFIMCIWREETTSAGTGVLANFHLFSAEASAAMLDLLVEKGVSNPKQVSSLWPGLDRPRNRVVPQAGSAGLPQPLKCPAQCGGKGSTSQGKLGKLLLWQLSKSPCAFSRCQPW